MTVNVLEGDCTEVMQTLPSESFDSAITDPPYHLVSIVKRFGAANAAPAQHGTDGAYARASKGFMGKSWDGGNVALRPETWAEVWRVLKPGAHLLAFGGTRTFHRMAVAIEDAGFEIRDCVMWLYGSGFPKSHDVSKGIGRAAGAEREVVGRGKTRKADSGPQTYAALGEFQQAAWVDVTAPATEAARQWQGWGTALKPAWEPVIVARKPLIGTVAGNVLMHGTGALNIDGCRIPLADGDALHDGVRHDGKRLDTGNADSVWGFRAVDRAPGLGRFPANVIHDGSDEVLRAFAAFEAPGQQADISATAPSAKTSHVYGAMRREGESSAGQRYTDRGATDFAALPGARRGDAGSAARFFYSSKADATDRLGSKHPTVKPVDLMRYLCRLVTPPGGMVLDPFAGSGTTGMAAMAEGFNATLIERDPDYVADIRRRIAHVSGADTPLFAAD